MAFNSHLPPGVIELPQVVLLRRVLQPYAHVFQQLDMIERMKAQLGGPHLSVVQGQTIPIVAAAEAAYAVWRETEAPLTVDADGRVDEGRLHHKACAHFGRGSASWRVSVKRFLAGQRPT